MENRSECGATQPCGTVIIPAAARMFVTVIEVRLPLIPDNVNVMHLPVVAWCIAPGSNFAEAILPHRSNSPSTDPFPLMVLIELPDGRFVDPGDRVYDDIEEAKLTALGTAQHLWEKWVEAHHERG